MCPIEKVNRFPVLLEHKDACVLMLLLGCYVMLELLFQMGAFLNGVISKHDTHVLIVYTCLKACS